MNATIFILVKTMDSVTWQRKRRTTIAIVLSVIPDRTVKHMHVINDLAVMGRVLKQTLILTTRVLVTMAITATRANMPVVQ